MQNYHDDGEVERQFLPPEPQRYMPFPGCRRCDGYGLRECELEGHDIPPTIEELEARQRQRG